MDVVEEVGTGALVLGVARADRSEEAAKGPPNCGAASAKRGATEATMTDEVRILALVFGYGLIDNSTLELFK